MAYNAQAVQRMLEGNLIIKTVQYHSREWDTLVETGWTTALVNTYPQRVGGPLVEWATMIKDIKP